MIASIYEKNIGLDLADALKDIILKKEPKILSMFEGRSTMITKGHPSKSMVGYFAYYNIFSWSDEPVLEFKEQIKNAIKDYEEIFGKKYETIYGKCWSPVLRKEEYIPKHNHTFAGDTHMYLSGHMTLQANNTKTYYTHNNEDHFIINKPGQLSLLPSNILHWTDKNPNDEVRVSIAFDLRPIPEKERYPFSHPVRLI